MGGVYLGTLWIDDDAPKPQEKSGGEKRESSKRGEYSRMTKESLIMEALRHRGAADSA